MKNMHIKKNAAQFIAGGLLVGISFLQLFAVTSSVIRHFSVGSSSNQVLAASMQNDLENEKNANEFTPTHIKISSVGIDLSVVPQSLNNGTWSVADGVANYATETNKVSKLGGNVGIYGHDLPNAFTQIKTIQLGDIVEIDGPGKKAYYQVVLSQTTQPESVNMFYPTQTPTLTLVTCEGIFSEQRFIVKAVLLNIEETI